MKLYFLAFLSWRYFKSILNDRASSFLLRMSWFSIGLTTLIIALSVSLFNGFHSAMYTNMQGINPPFFIEGLKNKKQYKTLKNYIKSSNLINQWTPLYHSYVLIDNNYHSLDALCMLQGIESNSYLQVTCFAKTLQPMSAADIQNTLSKRHVIIGNALAKKYDLNVGDTICLLYLSSYNDYKKLNFDRIQLSIGAIASTGVEELDAMLVVCHKTVYKELWPQKLPDSLGIILSNTTHASTVQSFIKNNFDAYCYPWQDLYPSLMSALYLEKIALYLFLGLLSFLSSMSIACSLLMIINYKRIEFALFRTMGACVSDLIVLIATIGLLITLTSAAVGCALAYVLSIIFSTYIVLPLPNAYYVTTLPFDTCLINFLAVFLFTALISLLSIAWAGAQVRAIHPAQTLRFER